MRSFEFWLYLLDERNRLSHIAAYVLASIGVGSFYYAAVYQPTYWKWEVAAGVICCVGAYGFAKIGDYFEERDVEESKRKLRHWRR